MNERSLFSVRDLILEAINDDETLNSGELSERARSHVLAHRRMRDHFNSATEAASRGEEYADGAAPLPDKVWISWHEHPDEPFRDRPISILEDGVWLTYRWCPVEEQAEIRQYTPAMVFFSLSEAAEESVCLQQEAEAARQARHEACDQIAALHPKLVPHLERVREQAEVYNMQDAIVQVCRHAHVNPVYPAETACSVPPARARARERSQQLDQLISTY